METRIIYNSETGEVMGSISFPEGTSEIRWQESVSKLENATFVEPE